MIDPKIDMVWEDKITNKLSCLKAIQFHIAKKLEIYCPIHVDTFVYPKKKLGEDSNIVRFLIMMKDWEDGHTLQVGTSWLGPGKSVMYILMASR